MKIGAHVSTAGGISNAVGRAKEIGCEAIQIFGSSPQTWAFKPAPGEQIESFKQGLAEAGAVLFDDMRALPALLGLQ